MTNQTAVTILKNLEQSLDDYCELNDEGKEAFHMAITALELFGISEQLPSAQSDVPDTNVGDTISRQAAISHVGDVPYIKEHPNVGLLWKAWIESLPPAQPEQRWIPCSEKLPENRVCVIVCFREWQQYAKRYIYSIVTGWYARKHSVRENVFIFNEWEADCDYDEDEDEFYILEGWYEFTTQGNADLMNWYINAEVVAWMPLPEPYEAERRTDDR